jgi:hypothetical protein
MLNRATPPERGPSGLLSFCALLSLEETMPAGISERLSDSVMAGWNRFADLHS